MTGAKILLVDDEREITLVLSEILREEGYEVSVAQNGWVALNQLADFHPDLVVCDNMMPVITGLDLLKKFREMPGHRETPFILMSAADLKARREDHRWTAFMKKPFSLDAILAAISEALVR